MKNKRSLWILIPLVLVLWGYIIFRVVDYRKGLSTQPISKLNSDPKLTELKGQDHFNQELLLDYPDPYGRPGVLEGRNRASAQRGIQQGKKGDNLPEKIVWPQLSYLGRVKGTGKTIYLIELNGRQLNFTEGENTSGIKLINGDIDRVLLEYKGEKSEFKR